MHHEHSGVGAVVASTTGRTFWLASRGVVFLNSVDCMYLGMVELQIKSSGEWGSVVTTTSCKL